MQNTPDTTTTARQPDALQLPYTLRALAAYTGVFRENLHDLAEAYAAALLLAQTTIAPRDGDPVYSMMNSLRETGFAHEEGIEDKIRRRFDAPTRISARASLPRTASTSSAGRT